VQLSVVPPGQQQVASLATKSHLTKSANTRTDNSKITNKNAGTSQFMTTMATKLADKDFAANRKK
jgi:hypothetical protein